MEEYSYFAHQFHQNTFRYMLEIHLINYINLGGLHDDL